ncbi:MAG TPA: Ig-like domain-containing protein, partial [Spirochaetota bacterium]|nr:Ig-like domain-containing protein [Spirochaetota bacterium]
MKYQLFFLGKMLSIAVVFSSVFYACGKESASVTPEDAISTFTTDNPGTLLITGTIAYPAPAEMDVPVNSKIVLIFSHDILPASANSTNITISPAVAGVHTYNVSGHVITITLANPMNYSTAYTVSTNTDLLGLSDSRHVSQSYSWSFTTAPNNTDNYQPRVIIRSPMGAGIPINRNYIEVTFNEDVSNVTMATFTISGGAAVSGVTNVAGTNTWRLNLSASLAYNTLYTVDLTNAITDAAGNTLLQDGMDTWNFQTELAPGANPPLTLSNGFAGNVTDTSADLSWQTSYAVDNSIVKFGISTTYPLIASNSYDTTPAGSGESQLFSVPLTALAAGTVYYYRIELPGATPNYLEGNFYTKNTVIPGTQISAGTNSSLSALQLKSINGTEDGSSAVLYSNAANTNVSFFSSAGVLLWQSTIDSNTMSSSGIYSDYSGGFFLNGINGGNVIVKRIYDNAGSAAFYYSHDASTGLSVAAGNSSSVTVTYGSQGDPNVYPGFVLNNNVASGTATMNIPANAFFDFGSDFTAGAFASVGDGDVVIELGGGYDGTTVNKTGSNYRHAMGQTSVSVAPGNLYQFADFATTDSFIARDHRINDYNDIPVALSQYISGTTVYSPHGWTSPAWLG